MRRRFCRISWSSPRVRMRPGRWRRASESREAHRRLEGLLPPVVAEVVEAGGGDGGALAGPRDARETMERPSSPRPRPSGDHLVRPRAAWWGGPGHGASPYPQRGRMAAHDRLPVGTLRRSTVADEHADEHRGPISTPDEIVDVLAGGGRPTAESRGPRLPARPRPADGRAAGAPPSRRRRAGGRRAGARHRPPAAGRHRRGPRRPTRRGPCAGRWGSGWRGSVGLHVEAKRYLVATEAGYGGVLTERQRGLAAPPGRGDGRAGRSGLPGPALGGRRRDAAPGRRQREGRGPRGWRPGQLGTPLACRQPACRGRQAERPVRPLATVGAPPGGGSGADTLRGVKATGERMERRIVPEQRRESWRQVSRRAPVGNRPSVRCAPKLHGEGFTW